MVMIWVLFIVVGGLAYLMVHLKFLRTLPMTSSQLAGVILTIALLPLLLASGIVAVIVGIQHGAPAGISLFKAYLMGAAPACVLAVAAVWHSEQRWGRIILAAVIFLISIIAPIYQATTGICNSGAKDMPLYFVLGYPLVAIFLAWRIIIRLLETHSMTYKARAQALRGWGKSWP